MSDRRTDVDGLARHPEWTGDNPDTRAAIEAAAPLSGAASRWGANWTSGTPVDVGPEDAREAVPGGAVAY